MKINNQLTIITKVALSAINLDDPSSPFDRAFCFEYKGQAFEFCKHETSFRAILSDDDYDYVYNKGLHEELDEHVLDNGMGV